MVTDSDEANPGALGVSQVRGKESAVVGGAGTRHEILATPPQLNQFNVQSSNLNGNAMIVGSLTQITNVVQPEVSEQSKSMAAPSVARLLTIKRRT
jgi:hypothetical protein